MEKTKDQNKYLVWARDNKYYLFLFLVGVLFFLLRIPGLFQPYHQDEYKWAMAVGFEEFSSPSIPHPPLARFLYLVVSTLFGNDYLRLLPMVLSFATLCILFIFVKKYYNTLAAYFSAFLFAIIPYSVLGSLQIDIDGAVLPFFSLITIYAYMLALECNFKNRKHLFIISLGILGGFISKLSFIIIPITLCVHFIYHRYLVDFVINDKKKFIKKVFVGFLGLVIVIGIAFLLRNNLFIFRYVKNFTHFSGRNYFELFFLSAKALIYLSPLLAIGLILNLKEWKKVSLWYIFISVSILFYGVVFDFTHRTLDRYFMVMILPLIVIVSVSLSNIITSFKKKEIILAVAVGLLMTGIGYSVFSFPHEVLPLNPKSGFIQALTTLNLNILIPLSGGSGPLGFYTSLLGVLVFWIASLVATVFFFINKGGYKKSAAIVLITTSIVYSMFINIEYLRGDFYGSTQRTLHTLVEHIRINSDISKVITYNDSGAYELIQMKKYYKRFYADPAYVVSNKEKFDSFEGHYIIMDFPKINKESFYFKYLETCKIIFKTSDKKIDGYVFDCR